MRLPFWLVCLPQFLSVLAKQTFSVQRNTHFFGDILKLPSSMCSSNTCGNFYAQRSSNDTQCSCVCLFNNATTVSWRNGSFGCIEDEKIREIELKGCRQVQFVDEKQTGALRTISVLNNSDTTIDLISDKHCVVLTVRFDYQACGGRWIPLNHSVEWRLQTSQLRANSRVGVQHKFTIRNTGIFQHLRGKILKFVVGCQAGNQNEEMCTLLKLAGSLTCPWTNPFSTIKAPTTTHLLNEPGAKPSSHMTIRNHARMTTAEATRSGQHILHEVPNGVPVTLIGVIAGSSVFVLLVVAITTVMICRWRSSRLSNQNESQPSKSKMNTVQVESADQESQSKIDEGKMAYQSLLPITEGAIERGLYMSPYNMPELSLEENNSARVPIGDNIYHLPEGPVIANSAKEVPRHADSEGNVLLNSECALNTPNIPEYDYADSHALCKLAIVPNRSGPSEVDHQIPRHKAPAADVPEGPKPDGCSLVDQEEEFHEQGPYYNKLEDPGSHEYSSSKCGVDGDQDVPKERAPYYCVLEGPDSVEEQEDVCYEGLETEGRLSISYQPLHKYAYVGVRDKPL